MPNPTLSPGSGISPPAEGTQSRPAPAIKQGACVGRGSLHCPVLHVSGWWVGLILGAYQESHLAASLSHILQRVFISYNADFWISILLTPVFTSHFIPNWSSKQGYNCGAPSISNTEHNALHMYILNTYGRPSYHRLGSDKDLLSSHRILSGSQSYAVKP